MNNSEKLKDIVTRYKQAQSDAGIVLEKMERKSRSGFEARKNRAINDLPEIENEYRQSIATVIAPVFVTGVGEQQFVDLAEAETDVVAVRPMQFVSDLADKIYTQSRQDGLLSPGQYEILFNELKNLSRGLGQVHLDLPPFNSQALQTKGQMYDYVKKTVIAANRGELFKESVVSRVATAALNKGFTGPVLPVMVLGVGTNEQSDIGQWMFRTKSVSYEATEDVSSEDVIEVFTQIKTNIKNA